MLENGSSHRVFRVVKSAIVTGVWIAMVGTVLGALVGVLLGGIRELTTGNSGGNGPLLFLLTGPVGGLSGIIYGIWKEVR